MNREEHERLLNEVRNDVYPLQRDFPHYHKKIPAGMVTLDIYRVLEMFEVTDNAIGHAIKKLMVAGRRGAKNAEKDVLEAAATLNRWATMRKENFLSNNPPEVPAPPTAEPVPLVLPGMPGNQPAAHVPPGRRPERCCFEHTVSLGSGRNTWTEPATCPVDGCNCKNCCDARIERTEKQERMSSNSRLDSRAS